MTNLGDQLWMASRQWEQGYNSLAVIRQLMLTNLNHVSDYVKTDILEAFQYLIQKRWVNYQILVQQHQRNENNKAENVSMIPDELYSKSEAEKMAAMEIIHRCEQQVRENKQLDKIDVRQLLAAFSLVVDGRDFSPIRVQLIWQLLNTPANFSDEPTAADAYKVLALMTQYFTEYGILLEGINSDRTGYLT